MNPNTRTIPTDSAAHRILSERASTNVPPNIAGNHGGTLGAAVSNGTPHGLQFGTATVQSKIGNTYAADQRVRGGPAVDRVMTPPTIVDTTQASVMRPAPRTPQSR